MNYRLFYLASIRYTERHNRRVDFVKLVPYAQLFHNDANLITKQILGILDPTTSSVFVAFRLLLVHTEDETGIKIGRSGGMLK